jgi:single-stranded DNA-binding protein
MNSVEMTGRLTADPKPSPTDAGRPVCDLRLTVDNGRYPSFDIDVSVFDAAAKVCAGRLSKDDEVRVRGELRFRVWQDRGRRWHREFSITGTVEPLEGLSADLADRPDPQPVGAALAQGSAEAGDQSRPASLIGARSGRYGDPYE